MIIHNQDCILLQYALKTGNVYLVILWQRNYWEHIIRNNKSYQNISEYIINNPLKWDNDYFNHAVPSGN